MEPIPGTRERRQRDREQRTQAILDGAKNVFISRGFRKATMDDVAASSGISKPTIYQYFKTKDELYCALTYPVIEDLKSDMEGMMNKMTGGGYRSGREIIQDHFDTYYRIFARDPDAFRIFMLFHQTRIIEEVDSHVRDYVVEAARQRYRGMRKIYTLAMERGFIREANVYHLQDLIWGSFQGIIQSLDIKSPGEKLNRNLKDTLAFARDTFITALVNE